MNMIKNEIINSIFEELKLIPEHRLVQLLEIIHFYRVGLENTEHSSQTKAITSNLSNNAVTVQQTITSVKFEP